MINVAPVRLFHLSAIISAERENSHIVFDCVKDKNAIDYADCTDSTGFFDPCIQWRFRFAHADKKERL